MTQDPDILRCAPLATGETRVWWMRESEILTEIVDYALDYLDRDEKMTYARYMLGAKKLEFAAGRILMKTMLGMHLHVSPALIRFRKNSYGKPYLDDLNANLFFNISHSTGIVMCTVSHREVGVDVEKSDVERYHVMQQVFSRQEIDWVESKSSPRAKRSAFYTLWTHKEAAMKATGTGFSVSPRSISVPLGSHSACKNTYDFFTFEPLAEYIATVATERDDALALVPVVGEVNPTQLYATVRQLWATSD